MKNRLTVLLALLLAFSLPGGCALQEDTVARLSLHFVWPEGESNRPDDFSGLEAVLSNRLNGFTYTRRLEADGRVEFRVQPGQYDVVVSHVFPSGTAVNASRSGLLLTEAGLVGADGVTESAELTLEFSVVVPNPMIIREIYYHGSATFSGASYTNDRYLELYNNGDRLLYLDSLCIATVFPYNSRSSNNSWVGSELIPVAGMIWMIPGDGDDEPLPPGTSCVLAFCAVDHSRRAVSGLDLSKADFGFYDPLLTGHEIAAGVKALKRIVAGQGTAWAWSVSSPATVVFRPEPGVAAYLADPETWERYEPGKTSGPRYWHILPEWILDGVETQESGAVLTRRLPAVTDAGPVQMASSLYSGKVITRKVRTEENGRIYYQDTNYSVLDFETDRDPAPRFNTRIQ